MICVFTGHRPEKLPWGYNEADSRCLALKVMLSRAVEKMADTGVDTFCCGMARGCDMYFAEAVMDEKTRRPNLRLEAWLPCLSQADRWALDDRKRWERLLTGCDRVLVLEPVYSSGCMLRRDMAMVDQAQLLLSVWDGSAGGTGWTVSYARRKGKRIEGLWL